MLHVYIRFCAQVFIKLDPKSTDYSKFSLAQDRAACQGNTHSLVSVMERAYSHVRRSSLLIILFTVKNIAI